MFHLLITLSLSLSLSLCDTCTHTYTRAHIRTHAHIIFPKGEQGFRIYKEDYMMGTLTVTHLETIDQYQLFCQYTHCVLIEHCKFYLYLIPIHSACHLNQQHTFTASTYMHTKALWRWASGEAAGEETLEAVVADLHTGGLVLYGRFP